MLHKLNHEEYDTLGTCCQYFLILQTPNGDTKLGNAFSTHHRGSFHLSDDYARLALPTHLSGMVTQCGTPVKYIRSSLYSTVNQPQQPHHIIHHQRGALLWCYMHGHCA